MHGKRYVGIFLIAVLATSLVLGSLITSNVSGEAEIKPSSPRRWGVFFGTTGDIRINVTEGGIAVRIEVPREFLPGVRENETSFVESDISNDYFYYSIIDQSQYYPYDPNSPYTIEVWNPPLYLKPECTGIFYEFTPPKYVLLKGLAAPNIAGIYNFTVRIAKTMGPDGYPVFPLLPDKVLQVPVSMREDPSHITGYIFDADPSTRKRILTKGVVYAIEVNTGVMGRGYVDRETGFFNITGLYAGEYRLEGSAGYFPETGYAYTITESPFTVTVGKDSRVSVGNFTLNRGCIIDGSLTYVDQLNNPIKPLDSPYLKALNYKELNYTVEAYDDYGRIVASKIYKSNNEPTEQFRLLLRNGTKHVGYPALGTEYAGFGPGRYRIKIWVYGFTVPEEDEDLRTVVFSHYGQKHTLATSRLPYGAVVTGTIRLFDGLELETPREGESKTYHSLTGKHFGGNILVHMYSSEGVLKGLAVLNRTSRDGIVQYADYSSGDETQLLKFYILGFSELHNRSYSGTWMVGSYPGPSPWDYGLEPGTYYIRVWIRGYLQKEVEEFIVPEASNVTATIDMQRGGAIQVTVQSMNTKVGTRIKQAPKKWLFLEMCPVPRLRVYFYRFGVQVGYAESTLRLGFPGVTETTATLNFTGHNWSTDDIIFRGYRPNALDAGEYTLKGYTYGYIQAIEFTTYVYLGQLSYAFFPLLIACEVHGTVLLMMNGVFVTLTENVTIRPEILSDGTLVGVDVVNATVGQSRFGFSTYGFYGRGHFFYVDPSGLRYRDYGLDTGSYEVFVPEFGYDRRFIQDIDVYVDLTDLGVMVGVLFHVERMIKIYGLILGFDAGDQLIPLVWASATAGVDGRVCYSFDGDFSLHVPTKTSTVVFSCPGYREHSETVTTNDQVGLLVILEQSGEPFP